MKQFLTSTTVLSSLCFFLCSCTEETVQTNEFGEFDQKVTISQEKKLLWFGENGSPVSNYELYYHGNKVDLDERAPAHLKSDDKKLKVVALDLAKPFYGGDEGTFCLLDNGVKSSLVMLKPNEAVFDIVPLVNFSRDTTQLCYLKDLQPIGNRRVLYSNYVIDEKTLKVVAQFAPISRYYRLDNGDSTNMDAYAFTYYGSSPDNSIIVRSFYPYMIDAHAELTSLFLSNIETGQTTEFPLVVREKDLVDTYNDKTDPKKPYQWFKENFDWEQTKKGYRLIVKSKILTPEKSTIK